MPKERIPFSETLGFESDDLKAAEKIFLEMLDDRTDTYKGSSDSLDKKLISIFIGSFLRAYRTAMAAIQSSEREGNLTETIKIIFLNAKSFMLKQTLPTSRDAGKRVDAYTLNAKMKGQALGCVLAGIEGITSSNFNPRAEPEQKRIKEEIISIVRDIRQEKYEGVSLRFIVKRINKITKKHRNITKYQKELLAAIAAIFSLQRNI